MCNAAEEIDNHQINELVVYLYVGADLDGFCYACVLYGMTSHIGPNKAAWIRWSQDKVGHCYNSL